MSIQSQNPDPKKTRIRKKSILSRIRGASQLGFFFVEYLRELEVFWYKKTRSILLVCAHKKIEQLPKMAKFCQL